MDILDKDQIRKWDKYTIEQEQISSLELMERASSAFVSWFMSLYFDKKRPIAVIAGPYNNGGDGLVVARLLMERGYAVHVHHLVLGKQLSQDNESNLKRLKLVCHYTEFCPLDIPEYAIIIDALLGTGIRGEIQEPFAEVVRYINTLSCEIVSVDLPSGLEADEHGNGIFIKDSKVLSFEIPKRSFFTQNINWTCRNIGLNKNFLKTAKSVYKVITREMIRDYVKTRNQEASKYDYGFAQLCGGSPGMLGAIILGSRAAMRSGLGRLSVSIPGIYQGAFLASCPEVMVVVDSMKNYDFLEYFAMASEQVTALAVGPGLGTTEESIRFVESFLSDNTLPCILDADALNIIARKGWHKRIPKQAIITPHEKEFDRLFGEHLDRNSRVNTQMQKAKELGIYIILKGRHTSITTPDGICYFNTTGNVGMATAGSGDVLTGMLLGFLGQCYNAKESCLIATYLHGLAGDHARLKYGEYSLMSSDIIAYIPEVLKGVNGA